MTVTLPDGRHRRRAQVLLNASRPSHKDIKHVLVVGYDTNLCVVDKPCGVVACRDRA